MRPNHDVNRRWLFLATLCGVTASLHCSSSDSGGNGGGNGGGSSASGNVAAFVGSWTCTLTETVVFTEPAGTPTATRTVQDTETFTQTGPNELDDGGDCPVKYRVSGNTATSEPRATCTSSDGSTTSNITATFTVGAGRLKGTEHASQTGKSNTGVSVAGTVTVQADCKPGILPDAGAGAGGSSSSDGGSGNSQGGSIDQGGGVSFGGSGNGGASDIGGSGNGGAGNAGNGGSVAIDAGSSDCGSYQGTPTLGTCMPQSAAPALSAVSWSQDSCATGELCVATTKAVDSTSKFAPCGTVDLPGACWPSYVLEDFVVGAGSLYAQGSCNVGEECMPCRNGSVPSLMFCND